MPVSRAQRIKRRNRQRWQDHHDRAILRRKGDLLQSLADDFGISRPFLLRGLAVTTCGRAPYSQYRNATEVKPEQRG